MSRKAPDEIRCETRKIVGLDQLVQVDAQKFHSDTQMATEIEVFRHFDNMVFLISVLSREVRYCSVTCNYDRIRTHLRKLSNILISTNAWWWNLFLLRMILIATDSPEQ